ncbi:uncharacterized protein [Solanum tuberosum]|uniref:uncharacterized protein n=1 Tax=Solanum tuberosum TaxID=4113 RepID=UPI00073A1D34|nr:PREDICTED: uncharacterized protein LOC107060767 [Solanum tuberosum]
MIHKEIEVYVDDVIIKSRESLDHLTHLRKFFDRLRRYILKLNPAKCAFGVPVGKLLGFIVNRMGIELDPSKSKAIQELPPPKTKKEVMSFLGRLNYISWFISQSMVVCEPIFKLLKKDALTKWTGECQTVFDAIKNYLSNPPVLFPPREGSPLLLYLSVSDNAFGCVLGQQDETGKKEGKAIKAQALADHLVENPVDEEYEPLKTYFPDEEVAFVGKDISEAYPSWRVCFDGAANHQEIHAGVYGTHMNGLTLAKKILRASYFWMTMEHDCCKFVQKYHKCQVHGDLIRVPPPKLNVMSSPWPFVAWGMDVIGLIESAASNGHRFILVAIDYFTKWVEAAPYKSVTKKVGADFVHNNLICRFGVPESIIIDNGANLNSHLMRKICYRTTIKTSIGATPYLLVYGTEAETELNDVDWVCKRIDQLTLIDEERMVADEYKGKFEPNWQGPYMDRKVLSGGVLVLSEMDGTEWPKPINSDTVKRYYIEENVEVENDEDVGQEEEVQAETTGKSFNEVTDFVKKVEGDSQRVAPSTDNRPSFDRTCYNCGEPGNMRKNCPHPRMMNSAQQQTRAVAPTGNGNNGRGHPQGGRRGNQ